MADYPYVVATRRLGEYFEKIQDVGQPDVADRSFLQSIGFGTENDRRILRVWEFIGFIDESKKPTDRWSSYRNKEQAPKVLGGAIRKAYRYLYRTYSNANEREADALTNIISAANPKASQNVLSLVVATFKGLCERADFDGDTADEMEEGYDDTGADLPEVTGEVPSPSASQNPVVAPTTTRPTVHIDLQIHISSEASPEQIDQIFASIAKHLYDR